MVRRSLSRSPESHCCWTWPRLPLCFVLDMCDSMLAPALAASVYRSSRRRERRYSGSMPLGRRTTASHTALGLSIRRLTGSDASSGFLSKKSGLRLWAGLTSGNGLRPARSSLNRPSILTISAARRSQWFPSSAHRFREASAFTLRSCSSMLPGLTLRAELMNMRSWTLFLRSAARLAPLLPSTTLALSAASLYRLTSLSPSVASVMLWFSIFSMLRVSSAGWLCPATTERASLALAMDELNARSAS
mmetsp:Transcript_35410/g.81016  ORF Transcript_35410/g.81016 Transcript_35410/m.81016 type:complete len:247 (-) Transcript_35410:723-1463(-)